MWRTKIATIALVATLFASTLAAQSFLSEDWSTGSGSTPPMGWSNQNLGNSSVPWRFDNPGGRFFDTPPFAGTFAICDTDNFGSSAFGTSNLVSPTFDASLATLLNLRFDHNYQHLTNPGSGIQVDVFDGTSWNTVMSWAANVGYLAPNTSTVVSELFDITAAAGASTNARLRFSYGYSWDWWWAIDNVRIDQPLPIDIALTSIDSPVDDPNSCFPLSGMHAVTVTIENQGQTLIATGNLIQIDLSVNGGTPVTEFLVLTADLLPNATTQYTLTNMANLPSPGTNSITVSAIYAGDGDPSDDSKTSSYPGGAAATVTLPYLENFDGGAPFSTVLPAGWQQDQFDSTGFDSDWYLMQGNTSSGVGPLAGDHTSGSGLYAHIEDSSDLPQVTMISPCIDLSTAVAPQCNFWLYSTNANPSGANVSENFLSVDVVAYPGGIVTMDAFGPQGDLGFGSQALGQWAQQTVSLIAFSGQTVQLRWRGTSDNSGLGSFYHDICVDDVRVFDPQPTPGQAPRTGMAAFDINGSVNVNGEVVASGLGGPYFGSVTQGGNMSMSFDGVPGQPIAVVYGALSPVSATYPGGIGQFDIGGPGVDANGIPLGLAVFVNAIGWAQGGFNGLPIDSLFFTGAAGTVTVNFLFPNFGIPSGSPLTTFQSAITDTVAPFVYISNAVSMKVN